MSACACASVFLIDLCYVVKLPVVAYGYLSKFDSWLTSDGINNACACASVCLIGLCYVVKLPVVAYGYLSKFDSWLTSDGTKKLQTRITVTLDHTPDRPKDQTPHISTYTHTLALLGCEHVLKWGVWSFGRSGVWSSVTVILVCNFLVIFIYFLLNFFNKFIIIFFF